jgi:dTDP-glucose 4,6-dehydratase
VYGPGVEGHKEWSPILPSNPYAASKAAQEAIAISYWRSYDVPLMITNTMNVVGERQDPVKFLPKTIRALLRDERITIHGRQGDIGSRHYLHARNAADAWVWLLQNRKPAAFALGDARPDRFNVCGLQRVDNLALAHEVALILGKKLRYELVDFHSARPGHDPHYALDGAKLAAAGWKAPVEFTESLVRTVRWTVAHPHWLEP